MSINKFKRMNRNPEVEAIIDGFSEEIRKLLDAHPSLKLQHIDYYCPIHVLYYRDEKLHKRLVFHLVYEKGNIRVIRLKNDDIASVPLNDPKCNPEYFTNKIMDYIWMLP